jgi:uncharacterized membrane protein YcaP (DUF421 family)
MNKNIDIEKIEIRSEKVRRIINEKPPFLIRHGTTILTIILVIIMIATYVIYLNNESVK